MAPVLLHALRAIRAAMERLTEAIERMTTEAAQATQAAHARTQVDMHAPRAPTPERQAARPPRSRSLLGRVAVWIAEQSG